MINFSFAITVCNEADELKRLLIQLKKCIVAGDEVVIQVDQNNTTEEVLKVVSDFEGVYSSSNSRSKKIITPVTKLFVELKGDFSDFKNNLKKNCTKDWIFFIDADEEVNEDDFTFEQNDVKVLVDATSMQYLTGATINYIEDLQGARFAITNPNAETSCGCGSSFSV